ncbi:hypothetical protein FRC06_006770 [Ceratobasidium sp. 370]|nr:hypothetical protein FRC06_006770 [Ceratobasidium sp. 370]
MSLPPWDQQVFSFGWDADKPAIPQCSTLNINFSNDLITIPNPPAAPPYTVNIYRGGFAPLTLEVGNTGESRISTRVAGPAETSPKQAQKGTYPWIVDLPVNATFILTMDDSAGYTGGISPRCTIVPGNSNCLRAAEPMKPMSLNFTRTGNSQCGNVNIAVYNGVSPFQVEIIPAFRQPKTLHFATNEFGFVLDLPSASAYAIAISDAEGNSAVDGILTVGSSSDNSCLNVATTVTVGMFTSVFTGSGVVMPSSTLANPSPGTVTSTSATTNMEATQQVSSHSSKTSAFPLGAIIGVAVGGAALIAVFMLLVCCIFRHHRRRSRETPGTNQPQGEGPKPEMSHMNSGYTSYVPHYAYSGAPEIQDSNTSYVSEPYAPSGAIATGQSHDFHANLPPFQYNEVTTHSPQARPPVQFGSYYSVSSTDPQALAPHRLSQDTGATTPIVGSQKSTETNSASSPRSADRKERMISPSPSSPSGSRAYSWGMAASPPPRSFTGTVLPPYELGPQSQEPTH